MIHHWTQIEIEILKERYPHCQTKELAKEFGVSDRKIYNMAYKLKLSKSEEYLNSDQSGRLTGKDTRGLGTRFKSGHRSWNKGLKGICIGGKETQFKKGNKPHNTKADGQISIRNDEGRKYKYIRLSLGVWKPLHVYNWEKANGSVPDNMIVVFKNKDTMSCDLSNLEIIDRKENMMRNTYHRYPEELSRLIQIKGALTRQINKQK